MRRTETGSSQLRLAVAALVLVVLGGVSLARAPDIGHATGVTLAIDAEISDGVCADIDATGNVPTNGAQVAVCLENPGSVAVAAFQYQLIYDDTIVVAPEIANQAPSLDDNPDANAGSTTFTSATYPDALGNGWTCEGGVAAYPTGDMDSATGAGNGRAYSGGCGSAPGPNTLIEGPLGLLTFNFVAGTPGQSATLEIAFAVITDDNLNEIGSCNPVEITPMSCAGATITAVTSPPPEPEMGLYFDADTSDGVCDVVQNNPSRAVNAGPVFDVAVCFKNRLGSPETLIGFNYHVLYNDTIVRVPEADDSGTGNDDNPDANAGSTTFGSSNLGTAWVCNFAGVYPRGDVSGSAFDGNGQARSGSCGWPNYPQPPNGGLSQGALGVLHLKTGAPGTTSLAFTPSSGVTPYSTGTGLTYSCGSASAPLFCYGASITVLCVQPDAECDGADDGIDNCLGLYNPDQFNTDSDPRDNGPLAPGNDATSMTTDALGNACDPDDDNDGITDADEAVHPVQNCPSSTAALNSLAIDSDGDHHHDGWECANGSDPANPASDFAGLGMADADSDRVQDRWELRGYNGSGGTADSDGDGCHDLVEVASIDANKTIAQADYLAVARRALNVWALNAAQDYVLDIDKNGVVADTDRLFVTRAGLLPDWLPKSCP